MKSLPVSTRRFCPRPLRNTILRFSSDLANQIKRIKRQFRRNGEVIDTFDWILAVKKLTKKWGLRKKSHDGMSGIIFISKKHGFVVKRSYLCLYGRPVPKCAIWTKAIPFRTPEDSCNDGPVYVQPLADVRIDSADSALEAINDSSIRVTDLHEGNVGVFHGKAVCIDW